MSGIVTYLVLLFVIAVSSKSCPGNQTWSECPSPCPLTCIKPTAGFCILRCDPSACICEEDYVSDEKGNCILQEDCPKPGQRCPRNQVWSNNPSPCPLTCNQPIRQEPCPLHFKLSPGCVCREDQGYVLSANNYCVPIGYCS